MAIKFLTDKGDFDAWVAYLGTVRVRPTVPIVQRPGTVSSSAVIKDDDLAVNGLKDHIRGLEEELDKAIS